MISYLRSNKLALLCNLGLIILCALIFYTTDNVGELRLIMLIPALYAANSAHQNIKDIKRVGASLWKWP